jgi:2'-5' RNA ligase
MTGLGIALDDRPFAPHVTLARKASRAVAPDEWPTFDWRPDGIVLVESLGGTAPYRLLHTWRCAP